MVCRPLKGTCCCPYWQNIVLLDITDDSDVLPNRHVAKEQVVFCAICGLNTSNGNLKFKKAVTVSILDMSTEFGYKFQY